ncbi:hypothetical protein CVT25_008815 [Psilocybe cyanescens]|uniref:Uncharacterized protein n=1 Tax=Psilocybe cyanescens TaxID=93625 RepID=A0A409XN88_PSICY|nr:hypothetical protein CVT25_008815 [Psilocybe cyanescens]
MSPPTTLTPVPTFTNAVGVGGTQATLTPKKGEIKHALRFTAVQAPSGGIKQLKNYNGFGKGSLS